MFIVQRSNLVANVTYPTVVNILTETITIDATKSYDPEAASL